jgi:leucyl-tRNA synthetase
MEYPFAEIEKRWQQAWADNQTYKADNTSELPKFYVLDMFPYPSGAGLHVGHPLGYIASDIVARYHKLKGYNVLHPMGFDAFGLPAEQYAIQTGKHPATTTRENIERYIGQLKKLGLAYDWDRQVTTSEPDYYKWTQWIFIQLFSHWYDTRLQKPRTISELETHLASQGTNDLHAAVSYNAISAEEWKAMSELQKSDFLMQFRLAYQAEATVNWCEALGTVLANDEVKDGLSERGGHPVERKKLKQWFLRITAYAERLLADLEFLGWSDAMKEMQRNWIGKSQGLRLSFSLDLPGSPSVEVFTTRPDTLFGVSFLVLAPEYENLEELVPFDYKSAVQEFVNSAKNRSDRERQANVVNPEGCFTGIYAIHPVSGVRLPVYLGEYVLAGYGTGAVMAVPAHDERDFRFAKRYDLPIPQVVLPPGVNALEESLESAFEAKEGTLMNSEFLNGLSVKDAIAKCIAHCREQGLGQAETQYRLRDANFSRQRYWGEPFPIVYRNGVPVALSEEELPLHLPVMEDFKPTGRPESPLTKATEWVNLSDGSERETDTMPGFAGSSWYFLRYMDPGNTEVFAGKEALNYWKDVDLYIGGTEHAVGHLLYARFWHKFLFDLGYLPTNEPFKKLVNQGMIQGRSSFVYRLKGENTYVSAGLISGREVSALHVDVSWVKDDVLDLERFKANFPDASGAAFELEAGCYFCGSEVEKMSKSKLNVVNPDEVVAQYGADTLRMYEMFLGPIEQSKPWSTRGIEGVHKFLRKLWRHCIDQEGNSVLIGEKPDEASLKTLHKFIKKIDSDINSLSLNTSISACMIALNEWQEQKCRSLAVFKDFLIVLSPFAPHICEEIWARSGGEGLVAEASFPQWNESYLQENQFEYPVSFNGKTRFKLSLPLSLSASEVQEIALSHPDSVKWLEGKPPKKCIVVPGRIINIVI